MNDSENELDLNKVVPFEINSLTRRLSRWGLIVAEFGAVQVGVQALTAVAGLLIVRTLSKQEYALFAIVNSMQTTCNLLAEWGIGIGLHSIGGRVWQDRYRFGQLLNAGLGLRRHFAVLSFALCLPVAGWMLWRNGAGSMQMVGLCATIAAGVIPLLGASVWHVSPLLHGEYRRIQKLDLGNAALRLVLIGILAIERINALLAALVGVVVNWIQTFFLRSWACEHADPGAAPNLDDRRELLSVSVKWLPNIVFFCFQGQLTLLILTFLGNPTNIADVTALGRVAMLFTVFSTTVTNVLAPRFARCQERIQLQQNYVLIVGASMLVLLPLFFGAWLLPEPFIWLLGDKYQQLGREFVWIFAACCVSQIAGVLWSLNSSRAWIRFQSFAFIPAILAAQVMAVLFLDLRQFHDVLIFNLLTVAAPIPLFVLDACHGLRMSVHQLPGNG